MTLTIHENPRYKRLRFFGDLDFLGLSVSVRQQRTIGCAGSDM